MNDFKRQWLAIREAVHAGVERVGESGWYILGDEVTAFEKAIAEIFGVAYAIGVGNGMDAIEIALRSLKIKPGEKVITTPLSAFATTLAIVRAGGVLSFVDVDESGGIDLQQCRDHLKRDRTIRFLVPVHLFGVPLDLVNLQELKHEFDLIVVEDCAQSIGASYRGITCGSVGQAAAISFYPTKNLGALGDGGAVLTNDVSVAIQARMLRNYGQIRYCEHTELGLNSRLDELHAAVMREALLPFLKTWTHDRQRIARAYLEGIKNPRLEMLKPSGHSNPVWHLFPVLVREGGRNSFRDHLRSNNIETGIHYPRTIPDQVAIKEIMHEILVEPAKARQFAKREVSLPIHPFLQEEEIQAVIEACNQWE